MWWSFVLTALIQNILEKLAAQKQNDKVQKDKHYYFDVWSLHI